MAPEIGQFALITAFFIAIYQAVFPAIGELKGDRALASTANASALLQAVLIIIAFGCLVFAHAASDFSVLNVFENSHSAKPFAYKIGGTWGNHEGSMLLWVLILAVFGGVLAATSKTRSPLITLTLCVQGLIAAFFIAFVLFTSNPFDRLFPAAPDGQDLNPLLQDPGLVIHPPFLYLGYVGFSITFAFAAAGLVNGRIDADWARAVRPWALIAWIFLTIGIALGSWWAYYELGWGGFWAWDPVENASFMPWLAGTAFIHSVRVVEKREALKVWTVLLAILAFSLSLVGAFLVRSGILTSVHAFAVDPARGVFILLILAVLIGGALTLFAIRAPKLRSQSNIHPISREGVLVINNVFLATACATVFIGTFYPLFVDVLSGERISVGAPYFNLVFSIIFGVMLLFLSPGAAIAWKKGDLKSVVERFWPLLAVSAIVLVIAVWLKWPAPVTAAFGLALAVWTGGGALLDTAHRIKLFSSPLQSSWKRLTGLPRSTLGMTTAHFGLAILVVGVMGAGVMRTETVRFLQPGQSLEVGGFTATLEQVITEPGPNYMSEEAVFLIARDGKTLRSLSAERRYYPVRAMQTTEAGIWTMLSGDLYLTLGEQNEQAGWAVRAWFNPFAVWLWIGSGLLALGGIIAMSDRGPSKLTEPVRVSARQVAEAA